MLKKIFIISSIFFIYTTSLYALDGMQKYVLKVAYNTGKNIITSDGTHFAKTLVSIALQESSAGKQLIGDKYEDKYYYLHYVNGKKQIHYVDKSDTYISNNKIYYLYKNTYVKKVYLLQGQLKPMYFSSLGVFQIQPTTAVFMIKKYLPQYHYLLKNKNELVKNLLSNVPFSANIAVHYLLYNYENAKSKHMFNPYFKSISKYNGGYHNVTYYNKIIKRMRWFEKTNLYQEIK